MGELKARLDQLKAFPQALWERHRPRQIPIAYKLTAIISLLVIVGMGIMSSVIIDSQENLLHEQIESHGRTVVRQFAESVKEPVLAEDLLSIDVLTAGLTSDGAVLGSAVVDHKGRVLARSGMVPIDGDVITKFDNREIFGTEVRSLSWNVGNNSQDDSVVSFISPAYFKDVRPGYVLVTLSRASLRQALRDLVRAVSAATILIVLLAIVTAYLMSQQISRPIHSLMTASKAIGAGQLDYRILERRNDEIGYLIDAFNNMADGLTEKNQVERAFSRFVSKKVAKQIMSDLENVELGGSHVVGTVLFADIVGYTDISKRLSPQETASMLNEYFSYIEQASQVYSGMIDKFMGDCAMVVFGIPEKDADHRYHAIACALLIQELIERVNVKRMGAGSFPVSFRVGINSGGMLAGNMGSSTRMEYTVVGDSVNLASRLCGFADPGQIIITQELHDELSLRGRIRTRPFKPIQLRSHRTPIDTFVVDGLAEAQQEIMRQHIDDILNAKDTV